MLADQSFVFADTTYAWSAHWSSEKGMLLTYNWLWLLAIGIFLVHFCSGKHVCTVLFQLMMSLNHFPGANAVQSK